MSTIVPRQLDGVSRILRDVVGPTITDPYTADVLAGVVATLDVLAAGHDEILAFLAWDAEQTRAVLDIVGVSTPVPPTASAALAEPDALEDHHREVRALLEASMAAVRSDPTATAAVVALVRERAARYPLTARPQKGP